MAYSNSPLVTYTNISPNRNHPRNRQIDRITPHCFVGQVTAKQGCDCFKPAGKRASCNYVVAKDGKVGLVVPEEDRSWCSSSSSNDHRAVTIEIASDTHAPYAIAGAAYEGTVDLMADICRRNGKTRLLWLGDKAKTLAYEPKPDEMVITVHRWFASKSCPGDYIYARLGQMAAEVTARLSGYAAKAPANKETAGTAATSIEKRIPANGADAAKEIRTGATVYFMGGKHYASSAAVTPAKSGVRAGTAKVTAVAGGKPHPYHLVHADKASDVYGWVDAGSIQA